MKGDVMAPAAAGAAAKPAKTAHDQKPKTGKVALADKVVPKRLACKALLARLLWTGRESKSGEEDTALKQEPSSNSRRNCLCWAVGNSSKTQRATT